jgi:hypothetical protein
MKVVAFKKRLINQQKRRYLKPYDKHQITEYEQKQIKIEKQKNENER